MKIVRRHPSLGPIAWSVCLVAAVWATDFIKLASFGLYEDDWTIIPQAIAMGPAELLRFAGHYIVTLSGHGRPLSNVFIYLFSNLTGSPTGLRFSYLLGFAIVALNVILFFLLVRRFAPLRFAALASLAFAVFPADTTQPFLTHSFGLQPSMTFALLAMHSYLSERRLLSYLLAGLCLFTYETPYPLLLVVPFLKGPYDRAKLRQALRHALILGGMMAAAAALRYLVGEGRVAGLGWPEVALTPARHVVVGPVVTLYTYLLRPIAVLRSMTWPLAAITLGGSAFIYLAIGYVNRAANAYPDFSVPGSAGSGSNLLARLVSRYRGLPPNAQAAVRLLGLGLAFLILAYPLTFTIRSYSLHGRATRIHFAASVGGSLIFASFTGLLIVQATFTTVRRLLASVWLALLLAHGWIVQNQYAQAWELEQDLWSSLLPLVADAGDGTVILLEPDGLQDVEEIGANTWNLPRILPQLYDIPDEWQQPPRVFRLVSNWQAHLITEEGQFDLFNLTVTSPDGYYRTVDSEDVIFLELQDGMLARSDDRLTVQGTDYPLKPTGSPALGRLATTSFYDLLIRGSAFDSASTVGATTGGMVAR